MKNKKIWTRAAAFVLAAMLIMSESTIVTLAEDTISATSYSVEETNEEAVLEQNTSEDTQVYDTTEDLTIVEDVDFTERSETTYVPEATETEEAMSQDANMEESAEISLENQDEEVVDTLEETEEILTASDESLFKFDAKKGEITGFADEVATVQTDIVIPSTIGGVAVKGIGKNAFEGSKYIGDVYTKAKLTIPSTLEYIGAYAFKNVEYLGEVVFESGNTAIEFGSYFGTAGTFVDCKSISSVTLSNRNTDIAVSMFKDCTSLETVTWSSELINIQENAFDNTALTEIDLSKCTKLTEIGNNAFRNTKSVKKVVLPGSLTKIGNSAFQACSIGTVFEGATLIIPGKVVSIGHYAFSECEFLKEVVFEEGDGEITFDTYFGTAGTFANDKNLKKVTLSNKITHLGEKSFYDNTALEEVVWDAELISIEDSSFYNTSLKSLNLSECVKLTSIGNSAFQKITELTNVVLPENLQSIGNGAFQYSSLGTYDNHMTLTIPGKVVSIGHHAFSECEFLKEVIFEEGAGEITFSSYFGTAGTFCNNKNLKKVTLSKKITKLETKAFYDDTNLEEVIWDTELISLGEYCFAKTILKSVDLSACMKLTTINNGAFDEISTLTSVKFPENLRIIGSNAFSKCPMGTVSQLGRIVIPGSVKEVGHQAFADNTYLGEVVFETGSDSLIKFGSSWGSYGTFKNCENLKGVKFSNCAGDIGSAMLADTPALAHIYIAYDSAEIYENLATQKFNTKPTIYCNAGSSAEAFAKKAGFKVKSLAEYPQISLGSGAPETGDDFEEDFKDEVTAETLTVTTTEGEAFGPLKEAAAKEGYVFAGWSLEKDNEKSIVTEETIAVKSGEQTLYAIYEEMVLLKGQQYNVNAYFKGAIDQYTKDCTKNNFTPTYKFKCVSRKTENATSKGKVSVNKKTGMLKATAAGNVTVILQVRVVKDGKKVYVDYYTLDLTVIDAAIKPITLTKFSMSANAINDGKQTGGITYISKMKDAMGMPTTPDELNKAKITYTFANEKSMQYIKINDNGLITPIANGTAKIYVNYTLGSSVVKKAVTVKVKIPVFSKSTLTIKAGKSGKVAIKNKPKSVAVVYQSSNANVATVDPTTGKVFGISAGTAEITATIDGEIYSYSVIVTP